MRYSCLSIERSVKWDSDSLAGIARYVKIPNRLAESSLGEPQVQFPAYSIQ